MLVNLVSPLGHLKPNPAFLDKIKDLIGGDAIRGVGDASGVTDIIIPSFLKREERIERGRGKRGKKDKRMIERDLVHGDDT